MDVLLPSPSCPKEGEGNTAGTVYELLSPDRFWEEDEKGYEPGTDLAPISLHLLSPAEQVQRSQGAKFVTKT